MLNYPFGLSITVTRCSRRAAASAAIGADAAKCIFVIWEDYLNDFPPASSPSANGALSGNGAICGFPAEPAGSSSGSGDFHP